MNRNLFWIHRTMMGDQYPDIGFEIFSAGHLIWLAILAAGMVIIIRYYRNGEVSRREHIRKTLAVFAILFEIFKQCVMGLMGLPVGKFLPLDLCSFAEYAILIDAMWPGNRFLKQPLGFLFLPAAVMALLFPTATVYPLLNFYTIHLFVLHGAITVYVLARCMTGEIVLNYVGIWTSLLKLLPVVAVIYLVDIHFDVNYFFLTDTYGNAMLEFLWRISGSRGGWYYIMALVLFSAIVLHILYLIYVVIRRIRNGMAKRDGFWD